MGDDCFYRTAKAFDGDKEKVSAYLDGIGARYGVEEDCVSFHPARVAEVEMPVVPAELERMKLLLRQLDDLGVRGINLLELCYPHRNWGDFARRGLALKNPPFEVLYDYGYAGGMAVAGSEEACLELVLFALDEGLSLGVHCCTLDNKNRDQMLQRNRAVALDPEV